ncbi:unnamed protein product [Clonostachys rhizophaga]|uniref:Uncharacterized protein n=1 Tax=Clonostachys rhizophaga TaxID=160324 RepID=A0A9N9YJ44_9HYPO|nr:unnamed protein product [Clonostachys rhizophaga]
MLPNLYIGNRDVEKQGLRSQLRLETSYDAFATANSFKSSKVKLRLSKKAYRTKLLQSGSPFSGYPNEDATRLCTKKDDRLQYSLSHDSLLIYTVQ